MILTEGSGCRARSSLKRAHRTTPEVDEARLVGVEGKSIPCETLAQDRQHAFGVDDVVERHQRIVGIPDKGALPSETRLHHSLEPFIQHMVQKDVREAG